MKYNIHNIWRSNTSARHAPADGPPLARGKPLSRLKARSPKSARTTWSDRLGVRGFESGGWPLLHFRDGPPICETHPFVALCEPSVNSVVKKERNHGEPRRRHRDHEVISNTLNKNRNDRYHCTAMGRLQEEELVQGSEWVAVFNRVEKRRK